MQFQKNTSMGRSKNSVILLIKVILFLGVISVAIMLLNKIDFPSPYKEIEKSISNENLKIVK